MDNFIIGLVILGIALIVIPIIACHSSNEIELIDKENIIHIKLKGWENCRVYKISRGEKKQIKNNGLEFYVTPGEYLIERG